MTKTNKIECALNEDSDQTGHLPPWSESSLTAWRKLGSLATHWVHSKDSDQTGRMPRLIWIFAGCTCHFVGFVMRRLMYTCTSNMIRHWWCIHSTCDSSPIFSLKSLSRTYSFYQKILNLSIRSAWTTKIIILYIFYKSPWNIEGKSPWDLFETYHMTVCNWWKTRSKHTGVIPGFNTQSTIRWSCWPVSLNTGRRLGKIA